MNLNYVVQKLHNPQEEPHNSTTKAILHFDQHIEKQQNQSSQQTEAKKQELYIVNLNTNVTKEDINELFRLNSTVYLRQNSNVQMPIDKNIGKPKGFTCLKVHRHASEELIKLNSLKFQNQYIRIE